MYWSYTVLMQSSLQQQIHFNGNIFGNKCCHCNKGSLYFITDSEFEILPMTSVTWLKQTLNSIAHVDSLSHLMTKHSLPSEDLDQPHRPPSLIRVFTVHMKKAWVLSYPLSVQQRLWSDCVDLIFFWAHVPFCWFCHEVDLALTCSYTQDSKHAGDAKHKTCWAQQLMQ